MAEQTARIIFRATPAHAAALQSLGGDRRMSATLRRLIEQAASARGLWPAVMVQGQTNGGHMESRNGQPA